jgi:superfamily II DNA or RNA helicase
VGTERKYVVKDIEKFRNGFYYSESFELGKSTSILLDAESFAPSSRPVIEFLMTYYREPRSYYYSSADRKRYMSMSFEAVDAFFTMMDGQKVEFEGRHDSGNYEVKCADYPLKVILNGTQDGIRMRYEPRFSVIAGSRLIMVKTGKTIYVCSEAYQIACEDLLFALDRSDGEITFAKEDVPALMSTVISRAGKHLLIESDEQAEKISPPDLVTRVYFDIDEEDHITARMVFSYGEKEHEAFHARGLSDAPNLAAEIYAETVLERYLGSVKCADGTLILLEDKNYDEKVYELAAHGVDEIRGFAEVYASERFGELKVHPPVKVTVGVKVDGRLLSVDFDAEGIDFKELAEVINSYRKAKKYHRLRDGSLLSLEDDSLSELSEIAEGLDLSDKDLAKGHALLEKNRALYIDAAMKKNEELRYNRDHAFRSIIRAMRDVADADYATPGFLDGVLRNYQKIGYQWLRTIDALGFGGILADDMGLGKTLQVLTMIQASKDEDSEADSKSSIVVCPASLVLNWESEATKFTPGLTLSVIIGTAAERQRLIESSGSSDLILTSYDLLKRDIQIYEGMEFRYVIIDEAQYIKNQTTQNAKAVKLLRGRTKLAMTGTPVENSLAELWSIFDFVMPGYLYNYNHFRKKYEIGITKRGDEEQIERLRSLVRPFIMRRLKSNVLKELPEKIESIHYSTMESEQRKVYLAALAQAKKELSKKLKEAGAGKSRIIVLAALTRMRQICCDPSLVFEGYSGGSAKLNACIELIESCMESGHRILLFSQFTSMMAIIEAELRKRDIRYYHLDGSTPKTERMALVNNFNSGDTPIFLISLKAGGTGLNLTGADIVIHYDPWWNISAQNQATDRAHRIGQTNSVQVFKLIAKDTIEERILDMQKRKADLADTVIKEGGGELGSLTEEEIMSLFEDR